MRYNMRTEWVRKHINDLVSEGLKQMSNPELDDNMFKIWLDYSKQVLEISTKDYNAAILLNYLRLIRTNIRLGVTKKNLELQDAKNICVGTLTRLQIMTYRELKSFFIQ